MGDIVFPVGLEEGSRTSTDSSLVSWVSFEVGIRYSLNDEASLLHGIVR